jgi:hypothetical protein
MDAHYLNRQLKDIEKTVKRVAALNSERGYPFNAYKASAAYKGLLSYKFLD